MTIISPPVRYKVRRWRKLNCKTVQYSRTSSNMCLEYLLGCWCPFPRSNPSKMNLCSCKRFVFEAYVWRMSGFMTMLAWMKLKKVIFQMANSITVLAFHDLLLLLLLWKRSRVWNSWSWTVMRSRWTVMNKSSTLKLNGLGVVWNMKGQVLVISKTSYVLVVDKLFPRSDDGLGKCRLSFCICMYNCCFIGY